ncbi:ABC transporter substrate-binding protein [Mesorhizobium sp. Z1-4]|uniref:ABC transporter substrate-binding protein n=1 Tax=Mesorhizobium sp. Z1-4 TaxID=2448478 RepID=UPI0013DE9B0D|nr:ABC transporter substrate-binding protein [Mesorhizobium sp. Z1-4]
MRPAEFLRGACAALSTTMLALALSSSPANADKITVTDIAGRTVELESDPSRIVLGEGRMLYSIAPLDRDNPFQRVVGWKDDLINYDPDAWRKYEALFPAARDIASLGNPYDAEYSLEKLIALDTELIVMNLGDLLKAQESGILEKLEKAGIPAVFIDFRQNPTENAIPSLMLLGKVLDRRDEAAEFIDFYTQQMSVITGRLAGVADEDKPLVFIETAAGYDPGACCRTFGGANLGRLVDLAGGINWGTRKFPGYGGAVNPEAIFADDPDVIIGTGANWAEARPATQAVLFGYEADDADIQKRLAALADRNGWPELSAVRNKRFHSVYHQFYNSPYHFVAMQAFAKWFHPELFADIDPEANFRLLHDRFLPIDYSGRFWATLQ